MTTTSTTSTSTTTAAANAAVVGEFIDRVFTQGDLSAVDDLLTDDFVNHDPPFPGAPLDREGFRIAGDVFRKACPDWHSDVERYVCDGDMVVEQFAASGTHRGELMGVAPTGNTLTLKGINIFRVRDGRIVERWGRLDELGLRTQLGLVEA
jgi:steroid delta-isomerase-like uncharacterized protein